MAPEITKNAPNHCTDVSLSMNNMHPNKIVTKGSIILNIAALVGPIISKPLNSPYMARTVENKTIPIIGNQVVGLKSKEILSVATPAINREKEANIDTKVEVIIGETSSIKRLLNNI
jgi:hypothetical protein